jgi:UDP-N-acetylmuramoyl-tripeptide--D-alanyl-D-alanine ligase
MKNSINAEFYKTTLDASGGLRQNPVKNSTVLLKGSRGMKLEALISQL